MTIKKILMTCLLSLAHNSLATEPPPTTTTEILTDSCLNKIRKETSLEKAQKMSKQEICNEMKNKIAAEATPVLNGSMVRASDDETDFRQHCTKADFNYCYEIMEKETEGKKWELASNRLNELKKHYNLSQ